MAILLIEDNARFDNAEYPNTAEIEYDGQAKLDIVVDPATTGTVEDRTEDDAAVLTLDEGHALSPGDIVDVYWTGGVRYGMSVDVVDENDVGVVGGAGSSLPANDTVVTVQAVREENFHVEGDRMVALLMFAAARATVVLGHYEPPTTTPEPTTSGEEPESGDTFIVDAVIIAGNAVTAGQSHRWTEISGAPNPLSGKMPTTARVTQSGTAAATLRFAALYH